MLNAGYDTVGVGVGCSGGQAYTVELFGFAYGDSRCGRRAARPPRTSVEGDPVPAGPSVAGLQTGAPVYCPGQTVGPNGAVTAGGGQYPYPYPVPAVPGEPLPYQPPPNPFVGIAASARGTGYWEVRADGTVDHPRQCRQLRLDGRQGPGRADHAHRGHAGRQGLLAGGRRRRHLQLR